MAEAEALAYAYCGLPLKPGFTRDRGTRGAGGTVAPGGGQPEFVPRAGAAIGTFRGCDRKDPADALLEAILCPARTSAASAWWGEREDTLNMGLSLYARVEKKFFDVQLQDATWAGDWTDRLGGGQPDGAVSAQFEDPDGAGFSGVSCLLERAAWFGLVRPGGGRSPR